MRDALDALLFGDATPDEAIAEANRKITAAIEAYNDENF